MTTPGEERPIQVEGVPPEEGLDTADAVERLDKDPDEQGWIQEHRQPEHKIEDYGPPEDSYTDRDAPEMP